MAGRENQNSHRRSTMSQKRSQSLKRKGIIANEMMCFNNANAERREKPQLIIGNGTEAHDTVVDGSDSTVMAASSSVSSQGELEEYPLGLLEEAIARRYEHMGNTGDW